MANSECRMKEQTARMGESEREREQMKLRSKKLYELGKEIKNETEKKNTKHLQREKTNNNNR